MLQNIGGKWELTKPGVLPSPLIQRGGVQIKKIAEDAEKQLFERLSESLWSFKWMSPQMQKTRQFDLSGCDASIRTGLPGGWLEGGGGGVGSRHYR